MGKHRRDRESQGLIVAYSKLGTISIGELRDALVEDINTLRDIYNIRYLRGARLKFVVTDETGEAIKVRRPAGGTVRYLDTHHFRPACKDYEL